MLEENVDTDTILVITTNDEVVTDDAKGGGSSGNPWHSKAGQIVNKMSVEKLETEMSKFLRMTSRIFNQAEQQKSQSGLQLEEIELAVEINGSGQVKLVGTGGTAGAKGAIKLKFKRANSR